jgi:hypothetical protein
VAAYIYVAIHALASMPSAPLLWLHVPQSVGLFIIVATYASVCRSVRPQLLLISFLCGIEVELCIL